MLDFCIESILDEINEKEKGFEQYFLARNQNSIVQLKQKELSQKIVNIESLRMLHHFMESQGDRSKDIYDELIRLKAKYMSYLDSSEQEFNKGLKLNFVSRVFELIIAKLIDNSGFKLITNPNQIKNRKNKNDCPDLYFDESFIECRLNNSSFIYDWDRLLPKFDNYCSVLHQILKIRNIQGYEYPCITIAQTWPLITKAQLENFAETLDCSLIEVHDKLNNWVLLNHHIRCYWDNFVPEETQSKLEQLNIKRTSSRAIDYDFLGKRVILSLFEKLSKSYFQGTRKGYVAISTTFLIPGLHLSESETIRLISYLSDNYIKLCSEVMSDDSKYDRNKVVTGVGNLLGVVLDTNWYNWFPDILKEHCQSHFNTPEQQNFYYLLYSQTNICQSHLDKFNTMMQYHVSFNFIQCVDCMFSNNDDFKKTKEINA